MARRLFAAARLAKIVIDSSDSFSTAAVLTRDTFMQDTTTAQQIVNALLSERVEPDTAARLALESPEICRRQLAYLDYQEEQHNRAAILVAAIENDWPEPARSYWERAARGSASSSGSFIEDVQNPVPSEAPPANSSTRISASSCAADANELIDALQVIAALEHAHRTGAGELCPVCIAWDALKQWSHRQAVAREETHNPIL
jgi:hypothetical protein